MTRDHVESADCWCKPTMFIVCTQCDGEGECWICDAGKIWINTAQLPLVDSPVVFVHHSRDATTKVNA